MKPSAAARDLPTTGAPGLVLLGLGPGDPGLLSGPARAALLRAERLWTDAPVSYTHLDVYKRQVMS